MQLTEFDHYKSNLIRFISLMLCVAASIPLALGSSRRGRTNLRGQNDPLSDLSDRKQNAISTRAIERIARIELNHKTSTTRCSTYSRNNRPKRPTELATRLVWSTKRYQNGTKQLYQHDHLMNCLNRTKPHDPLKDLPVGAERNH